MFKRGKKKDSGADGRAGRLGSIAAGIGALAGGVLFWRKHKTS